MSPRCPLCKAEYEKHPKSESCVIKTGSFERKCDRKKIQRYFCKTCRKSFSAALLDPFYRHRKRSGHETLAALLSATVSQRAAARIMTLNRKTVVRKFLILGELAGHQLEAFNKSFPSAIAMEFDDMETFEHTKCKPLSITLAVESQTRRILGFEISQMPAKGPLAPIALKKYGYRVDKRALGREKLFSSLKDLVVERALIKSDQNPHYVPAVRRHFPNARHMTFKGRRGCVVGQGELKKIGFDPLFSLNHTCAKLRADTNRLLRRTWCTTKKPERLRLHLNLVALNHNLGLNI